MPNGPPLQSGSRSTPHFGYAYSPVPPFPPHFKDDCHVVHQISYPYTVSPPLLSSMAPPTNVVYPPSVSGASAGYDTLGPQAGKSSPTLQIKTVAVQSSHQQAAEDVEPTPLVPSSSGYYSAPRSSAIISSYISSQKTHLDLQQSTPQKPISDGNTIDDQPKEDKCVGGAKSDEKCDTTVLPLDERLLETSNSLVMVDGHPMRKPRKPYTITKSREVWTKDEHSRFLSALQMYDRDWKKIEVYIGTKTVLQIRSHAQKHFGKVAKYKTGEYIPPPRPKKRSTLPYPRSRSTTPTKAVAAACSSEVESLIGNLDANSGYGSASASESAVGSDSGASKKQQPSSSKFDVVSNATGLPAVNHPKEKIGDSVTKGGPMALKQTSSAIDQEEQGNGGQSIDSKDAMVLCDGNGNEMSNKGENSGITFSPAVMSAPETKIAGNELGSVKEISKASACLSTRLVLSKSGEGVDVAEDKCFSGKRPSPTPDGEISSPKRQAIESPQIYCNNRKCVLEHQNSRGKGNQAVNLALLGAKNSLLVLSNCVDLMTRENKEDNEIEKTWSFNHCARTKAGRSRTSPSPTNRDEHESDTGYREHAAELKTSAQLLVNSVREHASLTEGNRGSLAMEGCDRPGGNGVSRLRGQSPPAETEGDEANEAVSMDPQRNSAGSGSASDDAMAGLTCSDRPSVSDNGVGSSSGGGGSRDSVVNSESGGGEEDPKSSNDGSSDDAVQQCPLSSRGSSPDDPNSSVSRETSPNNNTRDGQGNRSQGVGSSGNTNSASPNGCDVASSTTPASRAQLPSLPNIEKRDENSFTETRGTPNAIPLSKTIAHLINDPESLQCLMNSKRNHSMGDPGR